LLDYIRKSFGDRKWHFGKHDKSLTGLWVFGSILLAAIRHGKVPLPSPKLSPKLVNMGPKKMPLGNQLQELQPRFSAATITAYEPAIHQIASAMQNVIK
jgi:hypothetical protein